MNRVRVKICGLTRSGDVKAAVDAGADALGFVFTPRSKRFVEAHRAVELAAAIPAFISRVGLFMDQDAEEVNQVLRYVPLSLLQFHGNETPEFCNQFGRPWIKAVSMTSETGVRDAEQLYSAAAAKQPDQFAWFLV